MKKKILKGWVERTLIIINFIAIIIMASECENTNVFLISHVGALIILIINTNLLLKYGKDWM